MSGHHDCGDNGCLHKNLLGRGGGGRIGARGRPVGEEGKNEEEEERFVSPVELKCNSSPQTCVHIC